FSVTFSPVVKCSQNQVSANAFAKPEAGFKNDRAGECFRVFRPQCFFRIRQKLKSHRNHLAREERFTAGDSFKPFSQIVIQLSPVQLR
ncbi:hypothetical protein K26_18130, partial [Klebsiella pneumoniae]